eukprot:s7064_g2.t1
MLSRPNGELTQYYYQLIGRPPPSRQYDRNQPLIREGPNDYIMLRGGAKKLLRSPSGPEPEGVRARAARESLILELSDETYYLDATREWTFSQQAMQVVDDQVVVDTVLDQPLVALRDVSYQLFCGDEILESAFEQRPDKLCVAPIDQAREALLQGQVGGLGGARARHHPGRPAKRPEPRHALRHPVPAERGALGRVE